MQDAVQTAVVRASFTVGYGSFKLEENRYLSGAFVGLSLDADALSFGF